ncbi:three-Cys-motif partner protein TcmP [bacterium]|nr:three-Cys-motif partner protein TcmP [bacterium]
MAHQQDLFASPKPHTHAKLRILRDYLSAWTSILSNQSWVDELTYVDAFAFKGILKAGLRDDSTSEYGSPLVALDIFERQAIKRTNKTFNILCFEEKEKYYRELVNNLDLNFPKPKTNIVLEKGEFFNYLSGNGGNIELNSPIFTFLDPNGVRGIPASLTRKLLNIPNSEIFVNLMSGFIRRFVSVPSFQRHLVNTFDNQEAVNRIMGSNNRVEALIREYMKLLKSFGNIYVKYFEIQTRKGNTLFHLFFATSNVTGFKIMKDVMWNISTEEGYIFCDASSHNRLLLSKDQLLLLDSRLKNEVLDYVRRFNVVKVSSLYKHINQESEYFTENHARRMLKELEETRIVYIDRQSESKKIPSSASVRLVVNEY